MRASARVSTLRLWCAVTVLLAGAYAALTLASIAELPCETSLDPQRFCVWWEHSRLSTVLGVPGVLALGWYASAISHSRRPVTVVGVLVVLTCLALRQAAAPVFY